MELIRIAVISAAEGRGAEGEDEEEDGGEAVGPVDGFFARDFLLVAFGLPTPLVDLHELRGLPMAFTGGALGDLAPPALLFGLVLEMLSGEGGMDMVPTNEEPAGDDDPPVSGGCSASMALDLRAAMAAAMAGGTDAEVLLAKACWPNCGSKELPVAGIPPTETGWGCGWVE